VIILVRVPETASTAAETPVKTNETIQITTGSTIQRELAAGAKEVFVVSFEKGKLARFSIAKGDLVLSTVVYGPTGAKLLDHISEDFELVEISFPIQVTGTYRIELQSLEKATTRRKYELKTELRNFTALEQRDSDARQAITRADRLCADWTQNSFIQAIAQDDRAAQIWISISDFTSASHATRKAADVYFRLGEYPEALKRYKNAVTLAEKTGDWLARARALSHGARLQSYLGLNDVAEKQLAASLQLFKDHAARDPFSTNAYGEALTTLAEVSYAKGDFLKSSKHFEEALKIFTNDRRGEAKVRLFMGYIAGGVGDLERALKEISRAHELYTELNDKGGEALTLTALGLWHSSQDFEKSITFHKEAFEIFHSIGDRYGEGIALNAIGQGYEFLDEQGLALNSYEQALRLFEGIGAVDGISMSTFKIARMHDFAGRFEQALSYYGRSMRVSYAAGKVRNEGFALNEIATIYVKQGLHQRAAAQYQKVLGFFESIGDLRGQATALNSYGDYLLERGQKQKALELYNRALPLSEKVGDEDIRTSTLYNLARTNLTLGFTDTALTFIQLSLRNIEELRSTVRSPEFRASYFSGVQKHYELCIEILTQLDKLRPGAGFAAQAFQVSEKNRSRVLLDFVNESRANIREGAAKELLDQERRLGGLIRLQAQYRLDLLLNGKNSTEIAEVESQLAQLKADYQSVEAQLRQQNPRLLSLEQSAPPSLAQIQNELRNSDTVLLEYSLGEERSYLWAVTSNLFHTYELPPRKTVEDAANKCYKLLTARQGAIDNEYTANVEAADTLDLEISNLGKMLLGPVASQLGNSRLLVVSEGALQYVPFDALLVPNTNTRLLETNEVVVLPSVSTLIAIRSAHNHSTSTSKLVAVLADPVFSASDDRVQNGALAPVVAQAAPDKSVEQVFPTTFLRGGALARLPHASEEADAIVKVAPWGTTMVATGFDASRETAMSSDVGQYRVIHFATHGFLNSEHPELSGLVFTTTDRNGMKTNGFMPLHDIYSLDLSADLTVLSACQTGLGKEIKGEGLVGLAHGFMAAGSKSVVASLWKVDDRATAALMADFYQAMLDKGMTPAAALRSAKLKMMQEKTWGAPYYWAGFVLQGEYANPIAVNRRPWLQWWYVILFLLILIVTVLLVFQKRKRRIPLLPSN
jgi:CHAT domain-containing protein/TPR repeat protein